MRAFLAILVAGILSAAFAPNPARAFDPAHQGVILVNVAAPPHVEIEARLHLAAIHLASGPRVLPAAPVLTRLDSQELAGRAPRWASFTVEPSVVDSLVFTWAGFDVRIDEAWTHPAPGGVPTVIPLGRRVDAGEVVVLNLLWQPDLMAADDAAWRPRFEIEEFEEPPVGARLYVSEESQGVVAVHERAGGRLVRALATGGAPRDLAWDRLRQRLYVAVAGRDELVLFDDSRRDMIRRLPLSFGAEPTRLLLSNDLEVVSVLAPGRDAVFLFSASSLQEIARVAVGQGAVDLAVDPRSGRIFVSCRRAGRIDVIDPGQGRILHSFDGLDSPAEMEVLQSGVLAVAQDPGRRIDLLDPITGARLAELETCGPATGLVEAARTERLFVFSEFCEELAVYRPRAALEIGSIAIEPPFGQPTLGPRGVDMFLPLPDRGLLVVIPVDRVADYDQIDVGPGAWRALAP